MRSLSVRQNYLVDHHYAGSGKMCLCCRKLITGKVGETSIANCGIWHGFVDVVLGDDVPILTDEEDDTLEGSKSSSIEVKATAVVHSKRITSCNPNNSIFLSTEKDAVGVG